MGILVGGGPAPGINGAIGAAVVDDDGVEFPGLWPILGVFYNIFIATALCL